jgi:hypothetical protein
MHPQEVEKEEYNEVTEPPKLGDVWESSSSPFPYDSNLKTKNFITVQRVPCPVFYGTCYYDESDDDI